MYACKGEGGHDMYQWLRRIQSDDHLYEGERDADGLFDGHGTLRWACGSRRTGIWKAGKARGHGVAHYANGDMYDGEWAYTGGENYGTHNGLGTYTFATGRVYKGGFKDGLMHGHGVQLNSAGELEYEGEWAAARHEGETDALDLYDSKDWIAFPDRGTRGASVNLTTAVTM